MPKKKTKQEKKVEKEIIKIILFFVFLVILFFVASWFFEKMSKIEYEGLTFTKEKFGSLNFYYYYYYFTGDNGAVSRYNLYLRNDPRYNNVRVEANSPIIFEGAFGADPVIMLTIDTPSGLNSCGESFGAIGTLSGFLSDNGLDVRPGIMNPVEAILQNKTYATCENQKKVVNLKTIQVTSGEEETWINVDGKCHTITVGPDCEVMKAVEKYITQSIIDARANP